MEGHFILINQVSETDGGASGHTLDTVHVHSSVVPSCLLDELNSIIEYAFDLFSDVVFQMVFLILDVLIVVISAVVRCAIDDVRDVIFLKHFVVGRNVVAPKK